MKLQELEWKLKEEKNDYLDVEAMTAEEAFENVMKANKDLQGFEVQSIERIS